MMLNEPSTESKKIKKPFHKQKQTREKLCDIETIIDDARNGRMFILVDDEDRENEGDLIVPAQMCTPAKINFMAKYGRGLICLAMCKDDMDRLGLQLMPQTNSNRIATAFTISIEAREGVTTGISAADRAHTISVAISHQSGPSDITTPGHIFPVVAREGGVLTRAGHTEAAVDIARMAGLIPSGVICEIMGDDGEMARLDQLKIFAKQHHLNIGSIADLIAYRRRHDQLVECVSSRPVLIRGKMDFDLKIYRSHSPFGEHLALTKGVFKKKSEILVRMHALDILNDVLGGVIEGSEVNTIRQSLDAIEKQGCGALVLIREPSAISLSERVCGLDKTKDDQHKLSSSTILRNYGVGAQILIDLGIHKMKLLSNAKPTAIGLDGYGLEITGYQKLS